MSTTATGTTGTTGTVAASGNQYAFLNGDSGAKSALNTAKEQSDRFLKLLTTQLQNQDPMNPMDNAQMTSQMAQISTVTGIETMNKSIQALGSQFTQLQALQGASLVGRDVLLEGDRLAIGDGVGLGSFDMASAAGSVKLEVLNASGQVVDEQALGAKAAGRHNFEWDAGNVTDQAGYRFRITANTGGTSIAATPLMRDQVQAVNIGNNTLTLQLARNGSVGYDSIQSLN